jgi:transcriptional regulator with XRE-family HTH domain
MPILTNFRIRFSVIVSLSTKIRTKIQEKGLSPHAFEKQAGLKLSSVHNILYGRSKNPSINVLKTIAHALGCTVSELIEEKFDQGLSNNREVKEEKTPKDKIWDQIAWNQNLYLQCFDSVIHLIRKEKYTFSRDQLHNLAEEVYMYAIECGNKIPDKPFMKWLCKKNLGHAIPGS